MTQAPSSQLIRIARPGTDNSSHSKAQREFNRLTETISTLEAEIATLRTSAHTLQQRLRAEYLPLLHSYNQQRAELVRLFDRACDRPETTRSERRKLIDQIITLADELVNEHGLDDLRPLLDKYDPGNRNTDDDISTESEPAQPAEEPSAGPPPGDPANQKAKSAKKQARDAKRQLDERNSTKAVRTLYMDLVKTFHPDREPDEAEKERKTTIMQRVTEAYEKSDLMALLRLQLEFNRIDQQQLDTLVDEQLRYYNRILKQQADELNDELARIRSQLASIFGKPAVLLNSTLNLEYSLASDIRALKRALKTVKSDLKALRDPAVLSLWLNAYQR
ncbi:hypothetical protein [Spirosoma sordidisoli]|uniref:J domain-containing protein n=1 Tax=Spirosoma sordidisoli TaxID=2502893 RepID=A0A4Q2UJ20_9BACT|nr:hypothetical protein [Spirosoma sordidisoli]RYC69116.1 hypothetical protein EQG79_17105 [Spirosoma sordidisoli]